VGILSWLNRRRPDDEDLNDEIRAHLAIAADERVADGADPREARYAALREFGNVTRATEATRSVWTPRWLEGLRNVLRDVLYAIRTLAKHPGFSLTVVGVLALGIGLNAAVFAMLKGALLSPVAGVEGSARLSVVFAETKAGRPIRVSYPDYQYLRDHDRAFSGLFGSVVARLNVGRGRSARQVWGEMVTGNYFQVLGLSAHTGRTLLPSDEVAPGRHPVVAISDGFWRRQLGADPAVVGRTLEINNQILTVVGVVDAEFHGTTVVYDVDLFVPVMMAPSLGFMFDSREATPSGVLADRSAALFHPQGYLRRGTTRRDAAVQTEAIWAGLERNRPLTDAAERVRVVPFWQTPGGAPSYMLPTLGVLSAMGLLVLTIACANVAGLVVVRGASRRGEIAVRLALGATRRRIVRLLVIENLVLAVPGALLGVLLAHNGIPVLVGYAEWLAAPDLLFFNIEVDRLVIGFAVLVACGSVLVLGFMPALQSSRVDLVSVINEDASPRGAARGRMRSVLVVAQVAVSFMLLVGAGLVTRSLEAARRANPGFDPDNTMTLGLDVKQNRYDPSRGGVFYRKLLEAVRGDAGIESATLAAYTPLGMQDTRLSRVAIEGHEPAGGEDLLFMSNTVASDYFRTLRIPLVAGRPIEDRDDEDAEPVVMVNATLAQRFWGGAANAIGKRLRVAEGEWRTVVGVAADVKYSRIDEAPRPYFYLPFLQAYRSGMILHTRAAATEVHAHRLRAHVEALDGDLPIMYARPMTEQIRGAFIFLNLAATMLFVFGTAGMALAAMGTYGLVSYAVRQSTHEIGIRMALGASARSVVLGFIARGLRLGGIGAALGIVAAVGITRLLGSLLFGVSALDTVSFARALAIVLGGVVLSTLVPAWRAARTDPVRALRHQ
jgi:predicted permease